MGKLRIGLLAVDSNYPNLALMKISAYHKSLGDDVEWYNPLSHYEKVYLTKVFSFTHEYGCYINADEVERGGTGYDIRKVLPTKIDRLQPDYSLYSSIDNKTSYGFLTRGCPNHCKWCIVPQKEGGIMPYMDIEEIAIDGRTNVILMDNNVLASDLQQIEKIVKLHLRVDFNQAIDARLVTPEIAQLLAKVRWIKRIRFGCDTKAQIEQCEKAMTLIDRYGYKGEYFLYCILMDDFYEAFSRVNHWKERGRRYNPFCQPFRDPKGKNVIPQWQKDLAEWADKRQTFYACEFRDFEPRRGFRCGEYFMQNMKMIILVVVASVIAMALNREQK